MHLQKYQLMHLKNISIVFRYFHFWLSMDDGVWSADNFKNLQIIMCRIWNPLNPPRSAILDLPYIFIRPKSAHCLYLSLSTRCDLDLWIFRSSQIDFPRLLHGFDKVATWIYQSCFKVVLKFNQEFKSC